MFSLSFSVLTFKSKVMQSLIFRIAFSFFSFIIISAEFSSSEMLMVIRSWDLQISAFSAQSISKSSMRNLMSLSLSSPGTLSQLNKYFLRVSSLNILVKSVRKRATQKSLSLYKI